MQLYKRLRREYEHGLGTIRGIAQKYKVHRRTVRAALKSAVPRKRKVASRERPKMALAIPFIDAILGTGLEPPFNQRHRAHQIWRRHRPSFRERPVRRKDAPQQNGLPSCSKSLLPELFHLTYKWTSAGLREKEAGCCPFASGSKRTLLPLAEAFRPVGQTARL
jgi:hypothetical protein